MTTRSTSHDLDDAFVRHLIHEHRVCVRPRLDRLWSYYRNTLTPRAATGRSGRAYTLAQEAGLPPRLIGTPGVHDDDRPGSRREVVVENDIAWRVHLMVDFLAGRGVTIRSGASDEGTRTRIESVLSAVWEGSGGVALLQDMALLGHVYGHVDLVLRIDEEAMAGAAGDPSPALADAIRIELIEPTRGVPILSPSDYRALDGYLIHVEHEDNALAPRSERSHGDGPGASRRRVTTVETLTPGRRVVERDGRVVLDESSTLLPDVTPVVHVQNIAQPFRYAGLSEVEPLIPLQDELNTRLSDRACRVTMQSFNMYLAKGIDGFDRAPVGPGQVWSTSNPDASVQAFGGDASSPSEDAHIEQIREAMDKASAVPPLAGGVVRARIGNLSSASALRITLLALLAKTERKRLAYGRALTEMNALILRALDAGGVLPTESRERATSIEWPDPLAEIAASESAPNTPTR